MKIAVYSLLTAALALGGGAASAQTAARFDFGCGKVKKGWTAVAAERYTPARGYGLDLGTTAGALCRDRRALEGDLIASDTPFFFSVNLPEGNYTVTLTLGDPAAAGETLVKAESRRLVTGSVVATRAGEQAIVRFTVNVRRPQINATDSVDVGSRERGLLNWDGKLTLEFNGRRPCLAAMVVEKAAPGTPVIYLTGDSTTTDQDYEPWNSWGQMITGFLAPGIVVANYARSGETMERSLKLRRIAKIESLIRPGDYMFIQYGHNDMKLEGGVALYKANLERFVAVARQAGATPVLVTPLVRRSFLQDGKTLRNTHADYPDTVRAVAHELGVALIDLTEMSARLCESLGPEGSKTLFVDGTHPNNYGSWLVAKCMLQGIRESGLPLAGYILPSFTGFDPSDPDPITDFPIPASPQKDPDWPKKK